MLEIVLWLAALVFYAVPLFVLVNVALKDQPSLTPPFAPADPPSLNNFADAWVEGNLGPAFVTSGLITIVSVVFIVGLSALAAYPLARVTKKWSKFAFGFFVAGMVLPSIGTIPLYINMRDIGLLGSPVALILIYVGTQMPFNIFLYTIFLRAIPREYEEAATLDGCGPIRTFWSVVFPLVRPVTGTIVILSVITVYNDFFTPLLYLTSSDYTTVPLALRTFSGLYFTDWGAIFAGLLLAIAPVLIAYFLLQKNIIRGFAGGLKG
jgi:raffinose/stachyose/melibiose transport system permease protein